MSSQWDFYMARVDDQPASLCFDMGLATVAPIQGCDGRVHLSLVMQHPRSDGLSSNGELEALGAIEDAIVTAIQGQEHVYYAGRCTADGYRDFYFYTTQADQLQATLAEVMTGFPTYSFDTGACIDPEWRSYFDFLYPSRQDRERMSNRALQEALAAQGDQSDIPRMIHHLAVFPQPANRTAFAQHLRVQGFHIASQPKESRDDGFVIEFCRSDRPNQMDEVTIPLSEAVHDRDGDYDGWGCEVMH